MKLKKTRKERKCHVCKTLIYKGESYGQKSITIGSKKDGMTELFDKEKQAFVQPIQNFLDLLCNLIED